MEIFWTYLQSYQVYNDICTVNILLVYMYRWYSGGHVTGHLFLFEVAVDAAPGKREMTPGYLLFVEILDVCMTMEMQYCMSFTCI